MGLGANKMVKLFSFLFITVFFISNGRSQKLYIPVSNEEIIKIYKLGRNHLVASMCIQTRMVI